MNIVEDQPSLFETETVNAETKNVLLFALGDFQNRGFELVGRKLALDRLLGAFKRAFEHFGIEEVSDDDLALGLEKLGAKIDKVPNYVAKHPFRVTVTEELAQQGLKTYKSQIEEPE